MFSSAPPLWKSLTSGIKKTYIKGDLQYHKYSVCLCELNFPHVPFSYDLLSSCAVVSATLQMYLFFFLRTEAFAPFLGLQMFKQPNVALSHSLVILSSAASGSHPLSLARNAALVN